MYKVYSVTVDGDGQCAVFVIDELYDKTHLMLSGDNIHQPYYQEYAEGLCDALKLLNKKVSYFHISIVNKEDLEENKELLKSSKVYYEFENELREFGLL